jgi:hypothetical protein
MRTVLIILTAFLFLSVQFKAELRTMFGIRVAPQATGEMLTIVAFFSDGLMQSNRKILSRTEFIQFASGNWPSKYNRNRINLFELNDVAGGIYVDSVTNEKIPFCFALDDLWKLRYRHSPFKGESEEGWSQDDFLPSPQQQIYLHKNYGMEHINTRFFVDTNFWKILHDVGDLDWIDNYRNLPPLE